MERRLSTIISKEGTLYIARGIEVEIASQGKTVEEALKNLKEAFELWLKHADSDDLAVFSKTDASIMTQIVA